MAFKAGTTTFVAIDGVAGTPVNVSAYADQISWNQQTTILDVSTFGSVAMRRIPGLVDGGNISLSGPLDVGLGTFIAALYAAQSAGSSTATVQYGPGGSVSGQFKQSAEIWIENFNTSSSVTGRAEYSCSLQVDGAVTNGTW